MPTVKQQGSSSAYRSVKLALRNPRTCVLATLFLGTAIALLLTVFRGVPDPAYTDEFAYLLGADTFASGRLTNSTHPMWHHFETYHVIHQPSYIGKYQPAQSMVLAVGQLLGHPIIGACLSIGFSMAALVWMLTGWLPRKYNWLMVAFVIFHPTFHLAWGQSYWGGALPLTGASLMLGAFVRLDKTFQIRLALIAATGTVLLANCRPFEGAVLTAVVGIALIVKLIKNRKWRVRPFLARVILPGFLVLGLGVAWTLTYNHAVTGSPIKMPYRIYEANYGWTQLFLWQSAGEKPDYRHPIMDAAYVCDKEATDALFQSFVQTVTIKANSAVGILKFFCGGAIIFVLLSIPWWLKKTRCQTAFLLLVPVFLGGMATPWAYAHYCAPAAPLVILLLLASWIELWRMTRAMPALRVGLIVVVIVFQASWIYSELQRQNSIAQRTWAARRTAVAEQLIATPGRDLVFVNYSETHVPSHEWVYNDADIDASEIVWARVMSDEDNRELMQYFNDRKVWWLDGDVKPAVLNPYRQTLEAAPASD